MTTFIFFTKNRPPKRVRADTHIEACDRFFAENPDFHLSELIDIKTARTLEEKRKWGQGLYKKKVI